SLGPSAVVISDLGVASHIENPFFGVIQPYALRAPEVYLGIPYSSSADIWNLGCLLGPDELYFVTYCRLFCPEATDRWSRDDDILGLMVSVNRLTSFPVDVLARGKFSSKYFDKSGEQCVHLYDLAMLEARFPLQLEDDRKLLADMLSRMLRLRPEDRESARELLDHPWLRDF
ncbi:kinase-like domain-containing protein, partial [Armillaria borealis]